MSMTELEKHLLKGFERLEAQHNKQQSELLKAQSELQTMFEYISLENSTLKNQVAKSSEQAEILSKQVQHLSKQVQELARLYSTNKR